MNKKLLLTLLTFALAFCCANAQIQEQPSTAPQDSSLTSSSPQAGVSQQQELRPRYGKLSYHQLLTLMPEYKAAQEEMAHMRKQYEEEASYNETSFKRMFAEFLQGQKDFPKNIMLKRQRDLQEAMEKGIAFREEADSLLQAAEAEYQRTLCNRIDSAVYLVGAERGYECIFNTDNHAVPFLHPMITEDVTNYVLDKLKTIKP